MYKRLNGECMDVYVWMYVEIYVYAGGLDGWMNILRDGYKVEWVGGYVNGYIYIYICMKR